MRESRENSHEDCDVDERAHGQEISGIPQLPVESIRDIAEAQIAYNAAKGVDEKGN